jgi:hypothetical protein
MSVCMSVCMGMVVIIIRPSAVATESSIHSQYYGSANFLAPRPLTLKLPLAGMASILGEIAAERYKKAERQEALEREVEAIRERYAAKLEANPDEEQGLKLLQEAAWLGEFMTLKIKELEAQSKETKQEDAKKKKAEKQLKAKLAAEAKEKAKLAARRLKERNKTKAYRLRKEKEMGKEAFKNMGTEKKRAYRAKVKLDALQQLME